VALRAPGPPEPVRLRVDEINGVAGEPQLAELLGDGRHFIPRQRLEPDDLNDVTARGKST